MMQYLPAQNFFVRTQDINGHHQFYVMLGWFGRSRFSIEKFPDKVKAEFPVRGPGEKYFENCVAI
jgi:hypothetical protein